MDFSIGDLSRRTGVKVPTIRYYEKEGLLEPAVRTAGNQRRYRQQDLDRLGFIRHARDLGLPMVAVRKLLELSRHPDEPCSDVNRIAAEQLEAVRSRISQLRQLEKELARITASCDGNHQVRDCNILKAFGDHTQCKSEH